MSSFKCLVCRVEVHPHPDADRIEVARVGGYTCVIMKGQFHTDDLAIYIPEQAVIPDDILEETGLTGKLDGPECNRLTAKRLRGVLSQGLLYPIHGRKIPRDMTLREGQDVTELLGVVKYEYPIPSELAGKVMSVDGLVKYDMEDIKKYPGVIKPGEAVTITEKLHGILCRISRIDGTVYISSKGNGNHGLAFTPDNSNKYMRTYKKYQKEVEEVMYALGPEDYTIFAEIFGNGIQDLKYNTDPQMRVFDIHVNGKFLITEDVMTVLEGSKLQYVPVIYSGPFFDGLVERHAAGMSTIPGANNIREGVVIRPDVERIDMHAGRVIFKAKSSDYLLRDGGTEYE